MFITCFCDLCVYRFEFVASLALATGSVCGDSVHSLLMYTKELWNGCNFSDAYTKTVTSSVPCHRNLSKQSLLAMVYSGDHDFSIPHIGTQNWIRTLNLTTEEEWRPWFVDGQVARYTVKYINGDYTLIFATGAGHIAPEYKPRECYSMINRSSLISHFSNATQYEHKNLFSILAFECGRVSALRPALCFSNN
ncbi:hypothetical protein SLEP1_g13131 [Rubroshorea leprosula]|uniref:Serine carboxypeptidase n=1 Tax=Rubroshorea leprosula TaxID=152421 RepID=A0AAV5IJB2_9ROSI|nr:hypothetical protein SLEP1_g13131 [Rubroshorea leprosula]